MASTNPIPFYITGYEIPRHFSIMAYHDFPTSLFSINIFYIDSNISPQIRWVIFVLVHDNLFFLAV